MSFLQILHQRFIHMKASIIGFNFLADRKNLINSVHEEVFLSEHSSNPLALNISVQRRQVVFQMKYVSFLLREWNKFCFHRCRSYYYKLWLASEAHEAAESVPCKSLPISLIKRMRKDPMKEKHLLLCQRHSHIK